VWQYETENYVNGSPAVQSGRVIFGGCDGILHVVNLRDGKKVSSVEIGSYIAGSAAVDGRLAYLGHYGNEVICVDVAAGKKVWTYADRRFPYFSSPAVTADKVVIGGRDKRLHCLRRDNGRAIWEFRTRGKVDSSPTICDGKIVVGCEDGRLYLVDLANGSEIWSYNIGAPVMSSPTVHKGIVYVGADDGYVYAFRS
jgi:outer membrane protein assembly factor BamB